MFYTYIVSNINRNVLYTGHTDCLTSRISQHAGKSHAGFTAKYNCDLLLWYQLHESREAAFRRERQIKKWNRAWKEELIAEFNPGFADLYANITLDELYDQRRIYARSEDPRFHGDERLR